MDQWWRDFSSHELQCGNNHQLIHCFEPWQVPVPGVKVMKKWFALIVVVLVISATFHWRRKLGWGGTDDPCIKDNRIKKFEGEVNFMLQKRSGDHWTIFPLRERSFRERVREIDHKRREFACEFPPMAITDTDTLNPLGGVPHCQKAPHLDHPLNPSVKDKLMKAAEPVGKLQVVLTMGGKQEATFWGTGFLIAPRLVATTCHIVNSLLTPPNTTTLELGPDESMVIEFRNP